MIEVIKHSLGFCGEHWHPNLWTILIGGFGLSATLKYAVVYIKCKINKLINKNNEL